MLTLTQQINEFRTKFKNLVEKSSADTIENGILNQKLNRGLEGIAKVGEVVKNFSFVDQRGHKVDLASLKKTGDIVLLFYRGGWCPYCNMELQSYQRSLSKFKELGTTLIALSPEKPENAQATADANGLNFSVGTDENLSIARSFGLVFPVEGALKELYEKFKHPLNEANANGVWELPVPGVFVIGVDGKIRFASVNLDYRERLEPSEVIKFLESRYEK